MFIKIVIWGIVCTGTWEYIKHTRRQAQAQVLIYRACSTAGRNARMFLEYLNYVVHFLLIAQERKTQKIAQKQKQDNQR